MDVKRIGAEGRDGGLIICPGKTKTYKGPIYWDYCILWGLQNGVDHSLLPFDHSLLLL